MQGDYQSCAAISRSLCQCVDRQFGPSRIEGRERLIDQPQRCRREHSACQAHPLPFAAGEPVDTIPKLVGKVEAFQRGVGVGNAAGVDEGRRLCHETGRVVARQQRGDDALARRQRRVCGARNRRPRRCCKRATGKDQGSSPSMSKVPCDGLRAQAIACSSVVLPAPEGPITATCSPGAMARDERLESRRLGRRTGWMARLEAAQFDAQTAVT